MILNTLPLSHHKANIIECKPATLFLKRITVLKKREAKSDALPTEVCIFDCRYSQIITISYKNVLS